MLAEVLKTPGAGDDRKAGVGSIFIDTISRKGKPLTERLFFFFCLFPLSVDLTI